MWILLKFILDTSNCQYMQKLFRQTILKDLTINYNSQKIWIKSLKNLVTYNLNVGKFK